MKGRRERTQIAAAEFSYYYVAVVQLFPALSPRRRKIDRIPLSPIKNER